MRAAVTSVQGTSRRNFIAACSGKLPDVIAIVAEQQRWLSPGIEGMSLDPTAVSERMARSDTPATQAMTPQPVCVPVRPGTRAPLAELEYQLGYQINSTNEMWLERYDSRHPFGISGTVQAFLDVGAARDGVNPAESVESETVIRMGE